jgi:GT2 family glycosyltransferase
MGPEERCDIILPTCGEKGFVRDCIESLIKSTRYPYRLIVIDNGATGRAAEYLDSMARSGRIAMELLKPSANLGWIKSINNGLEVSKDSKYVCFQNDDTIFIEGWLEELVEIFEKDPKIGIANPEWEKPEGVSVDEYAPRIKKCKGRTIDTDYCRGHCFFIKREVVRRLGGFDEAYLPCYYDDRDYSLKAIQAGYRCVKAEGAFVYHIRNVTANALMEKKYIADIMERNGRIFYKRWGYPLKIVFVLDKIDEAGTLLKNMCMDQNKVILIAKKGAVVPYEHTNMRILRFNSLVYAPAALIYSISNRSTKRQKKTDFIFTDDNGFYSLLKIFAPFIPAEIAYKDDMYSLTREVIKVVSEKKEKSKSLIV